VKTALFLSLLAAAAPAFPATALFPKPLHLVKRVADPLAPRVRSVDQYCIGNRIVTISGAHVSIVDYDAQTVTDIDHAAATWSVTRFDELAAAHPKNAAPAANATVAATGMKTSAGGRSVDTFEIQSGQGRGTVGVDRSVSLSRAAVEALIGAAYPDVRRPEHDAILRAAAPPASTGRAIAKSVKDDDVLYALPSEQLLTLAADGGPVTVRTSVLRFDSELPPAAALLIDPGATRVESPTQRFAREMHDADTVPLAPKH
jgi:hypothetical protein